jgi:hypothetical protein
LPYITAWQDQFFSMCTYETSTTVINDSAGRQGKKIGYKLALYSIGIVELIVTNTIPLLSLM